MCRLPEVYVAWSGFIFLAEQKCATSSGSVLHVLHKPLMFIADHKYESPFRVSSSNFILGGKLTDHVGRVDFIFIILAMSWGGGGGGEVGSVWGRGGSLPCAPAPSLDETRALPLACATCDVFQYYWFLVVVIYYVLYHPYKYGCV